MGENPPAFGQKEAIELCWRIPADADGMRADRALVHRVRRLSRTKANDIIRRGDFRLDNRATKPSTRVVSGQRVSLWRMPPDEPEPTAGEPTIIHQGDDLLVVNKPGDMAMHPSARYLHTTLTAWLARYASTMEFAETPIPAHRIDRETSGIVLCGRTKSSERALKRAFEDGLVSKIYLALVRGKLSEACTVDAPLATQGDRGLVRIRMIVDPVGQPSRTSFEPLVYDDERDRTWVLCRPHTGRQHQIRAHLHHIGSPIVGDKLYAMGDEFFDAFTRFEADLDELEHTRQALHAAAISFPYAGEIRMFSALLPEDLVELTSAQATRRLAAAFSDRDLAELFTQRG